MLVIGLKEPGNLALPSRERHAGMPCLVNKTKVHVFTFLHLLAKEIRNFLRPVLVLYEIEHDTPPVFPVKSIAQEVKHLCLALLPNSILHQRVLQKPFACFLRELPNAISFFPL